MMVTLVESTTLRAIGYDESLARLRLEFRSRAVYDYFGVPATVYGTLLGAASVGACFNAVVRGCYPYCRVTPGEWERLAEGGQ